MKITEFEVGDIIENRWNICEIIDKDKGILKVIKQKLVDYEKCNSVGVVRDFSINYDGWSLVNKPEMKEENSMFKNVKSQIDMNKEIAIQESEKQLGKIILDQVKESDLFKELPGFIQDFLKKPFGTWVMVNGIIFLSNFYTGPMKEELNYLKSGLLRASYSDLGDTYVNNFFNKILTTIKEKLPKKEG